MSRLVWLVVLALASGGLASAQEVKSPDGDLAVTLRLTEGALSYSVRYKGRRVLEDSPLGLETNLGSLASGLTAAGVETATLDEHYVLPHGKVRQVQYRANELTARYSSAHGDTLAVILRVSNNNIAVAYGVDTKKQTRRIVVLGEKTGFKLPSKAVAFITPQAPAGTGYMASKPSYEEHYVMGEPIGSKSAYGLGYTFPALFHLNATDWLLLSETGVSSNYVGTRLGEATSGGLYSIAFPEQAENSGVGDRTVSASLPLLTSWKTITVGDTLQPIVETTVATDVVQPLVDPSEQYRAGRAAWSWLLWGDQSMNAKDQKAFIDLAAEMKFEYVLMDAYWDAEIGRDNMPDLVDHARTKNVGVLVWYNSNGSWNDAPQTPRNGMDTAPARQREMAWLQSIGVQGIKVDFFGGDKQVTMKLYEDILTDANRYGLIVNFHGATLPRGWEKMYPNFMTSEAVLASENLIFGQEFADREALSSTVLPFTRNTVAAMDFGPVLLNKTLSRDQLKGTQRRTSDAFQLATAVLYQSPLQHFGVTPNNLEEQPEFVLNFLREVPVAWDETRFVAGYPGKYAVVARRAGERWYIAATNAEPKRRDVTLHLPWLQNQELTLIHGKADRTAAQKRVRLDRNGSYRLPVAAGDGVVLFK